MSENQSDILGIKTLREQKENEKIIASKKEIEKMIFKDRIFEKFCSLSSEIIPSQDEQAKQ